MHSRTTRVRALTGVTLVAAATFVACEKPLVPTQPNTRLAAVIVQPDSVTLDPTQSTQFAVYGRTQAGDSVPVAVAWSASAGTITSTGHYTADGSDSDASVIAASTAAPQVSGTAHVRKRRLVQVILTPASATVPTGGTQQFTAYGLRNTGDSVAVSVSYTATGGTVSSSGLYTAGQVAGTYWVIATEVRTGLADTSAVTVTVVSGGPTILLQESFADNAFAARGWYDNTNMALTDTVHIPGSTHALEAHFRLGATTPTWGGAARHLFTATPTVYISYWVKYSDNWIGSGRNYHPHEFLVLSNLDGDYDRPSDNWLTLYLEHNYQNGGIPRLALQDNKAINTSYGTPPINLIGVTENRSTGGCNGVQEANLVTTCFNAPPWYNDKELHAPQVTFQPNPGPGYKGNWNQVEAYYQLNSVVGGVGQPDGVMQYWFNGTLVIDRHDIVFRTGARPTIQFHQFLIAPYIGDGSPADQYMWVDALTVATAKP